MAFEYLRATQYTAFSAVCAPDPRDCLLFFKVRFSQVLSAISHLNHAEGVHIINA
jgi:hypothetical protein